MSNCDNGNVCFWQEAVDYCAALGRGSRLPEVKELISLVDYSQFLPALPDGHPFTGVQSAVNYWSATTNASSPPGAWGVTFSDGHVDTSDKADGMDHAWCVR